MERNYKNLLGRPPPRTGIEILPTRADLPIQSEPRSRHETADAIKQLNQGQVAGPDIITPETLTVHVDVNTDSVQPLFEKMWRQGTFPKDWKVGHLVNIPKEVDLINFGYCREIILLSILGEVFVRIVVS